MVIHRRLGDITASDCHPLTHSFLSSNLLLNGLPDLKYETGNWGCGNPEPGEFDLIIGRDVLYERSHPEQPWALQPGHGLAWLHADNASLDDGSPYRGRLLPYRRL